MEDVTKTPTVNIYCNDEYVFCLEEVHDEVNGKVDVTINYDEKYKELLAEYLSAHNLEEATPEVKSKFVTYLIYCATDGVDGFNVRIL